MELVLKLHEYCTANNIEYAIRYATDAIKKWQASGNPACLPLFCEKQGKP